MQTVLIILAILAVAAGVYYFFWKRGDIADRDQDYIPDVVEDKVDDVKEDIRDVKDKVKRRVRRVKEELKDVGEALGDVVDQTKDIGAAVKGKPRRGRKPKNKK